MEVRVDIGEGRPFLIGRSGTKKYTHRTETLGVLVRARKPLTTTETMSRINSKDITPDRHRYNTSTARAHLERGGLVERVGSSRPPTWVVTPLGREAWRQVRALPALMRRRLVELKDQPHDEPEPDWAIGAFVRPLRRKYWFDMQVRSRQFKLPRRMVRRCEAILQQALERRMRDGTIAEVYRLNEESCTIRLKRERRQVVPYGGLLVAHEIAKEIEKALNAE